MASRQFVVLAIVAVVLPTVAMAAEFTVGDDKGWTNKVDYQAWAKGKTFLVGDTLVFKYTQGNHNVFKVNGPAFKDCTIPPSNEALTSGNDTITLDTPGNKWYICGINDHCANGQKLVITVHGSLSPEPTPTPIPEAPGPSAPSPNSAHGFSVSGDLVPMAAMVAVALLAV
ncbi:mavicyanin-like [Vitis riparia]|uniref:mavicyanin-like n=1 Tax=Vitis riparia TaxID=96939 RepID=UPI00155A738D|nr:mavicyanin-like [Vitis riparia]